jgi:hypothetical protein
VKLNTSGWFLNQNIDDEAIVYPLKYWRDAVNFPLLIQATRGNTRAGLDVNNSHYQNRYTVDVQTMAGKLKQTLKVKSALMCAEVYLFCIDDISGTRKFPINKDMAAGAIDSFKAAYHKINKQGNYYVNVNEWPIHIGLRYHKKASGGGASSQMDDTYICELVRRAFQSTATTVIMLSEALRQPSL